MTGHRPATPPIVTPDGRYIVVRGRLWRAADPRLSPGRRQELVDQLMAARRAVRAALGGDDRDALRAARAGVEAAKQALGERGAVWWEDGAPDLNRRRVENSPYAGWWNDRVGELAAPAAADRAA